MHLGLIADGVAEGDALSRRQVPAPFFETHFALALARTVMAATRLGVFESLGEAPATADHIAQRCGTDPKATRQLLVALAGSDYLRNAGGQYSLTEKARGWLLCGIPGSVTDSVMFAYYEWALMGHIEEYVLTGLAVDFHDLMTADQWTLYQRSMRALATQSAQEAALAIPVPDGATDMIDVGGSHGYYSVALCRQHPGLHSVVLDIPNAITAAAPILAAEKMGDRVVHLEGDALEHDFGVDNYDLVLLSNLAHHFSAIQNAELIQRLARSLRPHGVLAVIEPIRSDATTSADQFAALNELYFGVTSRSGIWTAREIAQWQWQAGLKPLTEPIMLSGGYVAVQTATKSANDDQR